MFPQKTSQNIVIIAGIHGNVFPWQPTIMGSLSCISHLPSFICFSIMLAPVISSLDKTYCTFCDVCVWGWGLRCGWSLDASAPVSLIVSEVRPSGCGCEGVSVGALILITELSKCPTFQSFRVLLSYADSLVLTVNVVHETMSVMCKRKYLTKN